MNNEKMTETRRWNLKNWMVEKNINQTEVANLLGVGRAYVSLLQRRHFGEKTARAIELKLRMPTGFLDLDGAKPKVLEVWDKPADLPLDVYALVPRPAIKLLAGHGWVPTDEPELPPLAFRREWLQDKQVTSKTNLRVISVHGDSMAPHLQDGDVVLLDVGQTTIMDNEIYAIIHGNELRIKRLMKTFDGGLRIRSDHPGYPEEVLTAEQAASLGCIGKILWRAG